MQEAEMTTYQVKYYCIDCDKNHEHTFSKTGPKDKHLVPTSHRCPTCGVFARCRVTEVAE